MQAEKSLQAQLNAAGGDVVAIAKAAAAKLPIVKASAVAVRAQRLDQIR